MPIYHPPRREPRVLAVELAGETIAWAVADPFMLRGAGREPTRGGQSAPTLLRLTRREKPTFLVTSDENLASALRHVSRRTGIPVATQRPPRLSRSVAADLYPELRALASGRLGPLAVRAIAAVLYADTPPRRYATRRNPTPSRRS